MLALARAPIPALSARCTLRIARGVRAMEAALLAELERLVAPGALDPSLLGQPVRILVPSRSLRHHVSAALVRHRGRALVGVGVHTLHGLAMEMLDRVSGDLPASAALYDVLVQRHARAEPVLRDALEPLVDGYAAVGGSVQDLLDAGLEPVLLDSLEERLEVGGERGGTRSEMSRAGALLRVAAATAEDMDRYGIGRTGALYRRAKEAIEADPEAALPTRAVLFYGFTNLSALGGDLMDALISAFPSVVFLDEPPDPVWPDEPDLGVEATRRLQDRLSGARRITERDHPPPPALHLFRASGAWEEAREVAHRARALLDAGLQAERIAITARELRSYRMPLRMHLRRLGVPFSGLGALGPAGGAGRRVRALLDVARRRAEVPVDRWLDALGPPHRLGGSEAKGLGTGRLFDLRLALRALGAARISDVALLDARHVLAGRKSLPLPTRRGVQDTAPVAEVEGGEDVEAGGDATAQVLRRHLPGDMLERAVLGARELVDAFAEWPGSASLPEHVRRVRGLLRLLGWDADVDAARPVFGALGALEREFPGKIPLDYDEFSLLLARGLYDVGSEPIGGKGAGVAVLSAREARGLSFDHTFILGLNRDAFPRPGREDPMLSDTARRRLREMLPDLPVRGDALRDERLLFAELVSGAPEVTLSWQAVDDDGKARPPSPLVERLRWAKDVAEPEVVAPLYDATVPPPRDRVLPIEDHALLAALHGGRHALAELLPLALLDDRLSALSLPPIALVAAARLAVLEEFDPDRHTREGRARLDSLGPYFGFIGAAMNDTLRRDIFITTVERLARCPWQVFVERLLRLEVPPDPMENLPGIDGAMVGNVVHRVLERASGGTPEAEPVPLGGLLTSVGHALAWPGEAEIERALHEESERVLRESGIGLPGFARALVSLARPYVASARARDLALGDVAVLGTEAEGVVNVIDAAGAGREIRFKVDRVDRVGDELWLTDYKTGSLTDALRKKQETTRHENLLGKVRSGEYLQAVAYALSAQGTVGAGAGATGRYLYLDPDLEDDWRSHKVTADETDFAAAFEDATRKALRVWDEGSFFPRLVEPDKDEAPALCRYCKVREACNHGDSSARGRLKRWAARAREHETTGTPVTSPEAAAFDVWRLAVKDKGEDT